MLRRVAIHLTLCFTWTVLAVLIVPFSWVAMNELFWWAGVGPVLTERPVAVVHHRMMGTMQELDRHGDAIAYLRSHLVVYPESVERETWQSQLEQAQSERNWLLAKLITVFAMLYVPVAAFIEMWRRWCPPGELPDTAMGSARLEMNR